MTEPNWRCEAGIATPAQRDQAGAGDRATRPRETNMLCTWGACVPMPGNPGTCNRCGDVIAPQA